MGVTQSRDSATAAFVESSLIGAGREPYVWVCPIEGAYRMEHELALVEQRAQRLSETHLWDLPVTTSGRYYTDEACEDCQREDWLWERADREREDRMVGL